MPKTAETGTKRRRGGGLRSLATSLPTATARLLGRRGYVEGALLSDWNDVVGDVIAERCLPLRISRRREPDGGTLLLRVAPGFALELQHLEPQLIQRINGYFGYRAVQRLKFQQGPVPSVPARKRRAAAPAITPSAAADAKLQRKLAVVDDEPLRAALNRLGRAIDAATAATSEDGRGSRCRETMESEPGKG